MENQIVATKSQKKQLNREKKTNKIVVLLFVGSLIGFLNGFFGGGGGMICVPVLQRLGLHPKKAHATAIAIIFPLSFVSSVIYVFKGYIRTIPFLNVGIGVILGGILGAFLLKWLPTKVVSILFSLLMIVAGVRLII